MEFPGTIIFGPSTSLTARSNEQESASPPTSVTIHVITTGVGTSPISSNRSMRKPDKVFCPVCSPFLSV